MHRIVAVMGTDGSGKTTLCTALIGKLSDQGVDAVREWLGAESYLMAPIRWLLKLKWKQTAPDDGADTDTHYKIEVAQKRAMAGRMSWAKHIYICALMLDYRAQLAVKLMRNRRRGLLVADRYLFDVVVNLAMTLGLTPAEAVEFCQRQLSRVPLPQVRIFLRVDPEISMQRKDDISDIEYLRLRFKYYEALASAFGFVVLDGRDPIDENSSRLMDHVAEAFSKPSVHYVHANNGDVGGADLVLVSMAHQMRSWNGGYRTAVNLRLPTSATTSHAEVGTPVMLSPVIRPQLANGTRGILKLALLGPAAVVHFVRLFRREDPDIVHVNDLYDFLPAIAARICRIPVVYHIRMIRQGPLRGAFSYMLPHISDKVISVSRAVQDIYLSGRCREGHYNVIHDLGNKALVEFSGDVTNNQERPPELADGEHLVLMVGRIQEWKGQNIFLKAVGMLSEDLRRRNAFALVGGEVEGRSEYWGSPEYFHTVIEEAAHLGVQWLGQRNDVDSLLLAADISVHCSVRPDPFPGVVIESLLAGAATIATGIGGVPEMINSDEVGILYPPGEARVLADHLHRLLTQPTRPREQYGVAARSRGLQLVDPAVVNGQLDELYRGLLKGPVPSALLPLVPAPNATSVTDAPGRLTHPPVNKGKANDFR